MKTSNKLLLGFIIFVFLVPVCTSFVLKGLIKKNIYTTALYPSAGYYQQGTFGDYKVIKIVNNSFVDDRDKFICTLHYSPDNKYFFADESHDPGMFDSIDVKIKNDTLLIERFTIYSLWPEMMHTHAKAMANLITRYVDVYLPKLDNIIAYGTNVQIDSSNISSININLKKQSSLIFGAVYSEFSGRTYNNVIHLNKLNLTADSSTLNINAHIVVDSLTLNMNNRSKIDAFLQAGSDIRTIDGTLDKQTEIKGNSDIENRLKSLMK